MAASDPTFDQLRRSIQSRDLNSVYLIQGKESYFIDKLVEALENALPEEDREFGLTNVYAPEVADPQAIIDLCRQIPMMSDRQMVIVREAQTVRADFADKLARYVASPTPSTVLAIVSRGDVIKGKELVKAVRSARGVVFEAKEVYESQVPDMIRMFIKDKGLNSEPKAVEMLAQYVGTGLSRLYNEIGKLAEILPAGATVTPEAVERNIGISKDYNNFELVDAIASKDFGAMMRIATYFAANQKANPFVVTASTVFNFFADLLQAYYAPDRSDRGIVEALGLNPRNVFAVRRIRRGMQNYNAFQVIEILDAVRRYDAMSKGVDSRQDPYKLMGDLFYHIATAPGHLPV